MSRPSSVATLSLNAVVSQVNGTKSQAANTQSEAEPYTPVNALTLFGKYADASEPDVIGPEGFEALCKDASISMEGVQPLMMAWQMGAKEMAKFTKDEWTKGTSTLKCVVIFSVLCSITHGLDRVSSLPALRTALSELEDLLILDKPVVKQSKTEPYNRASYWQYSKDRKATFHELYNFCFALAKSE
ncbi:hypothetical protein VNI00_003470 [Paramarasmius palmivorus]|uniref:Defective in cullin neddylation protein n=1 Tax=Paramarasmius palmivorus TaxID=297713 RepID=A0AAW0DVU9_9AGAR